MSGNFDFSSASHGAQVSGSFEDINKLIFVEQHLSLDSGAVRGVKDDDSSSGKHSGGRLTPTFSSNKHNKSAPIGIPNSSSTSNPIPLSPLSHAIHGFNSFADPNSNRGNGGSASKVFPLLAESPSNANHHASNSFLQNNFQFALGTSPGASSSLYPPSSTWFGYNNNNSNHISSSPPVSGNGNNTINATLSAPVKNINSSTTIATNNPNNNGTNPNAHPFPFHPQQQQQQQQSGPVAFRQQNSPHNPAPLQRSLSSDSINQYTQPQNGGVWGAGNGGGGMHKSYSDYQYDNSNSNGGYYVSGNNNNNNSNNNNNNSRNNNNNNNNNHNSGKQQHIGNINQNNVGKQNLPRGANNPSRQQQSGQNRAGNNASNNNFNSNNRDRNNGSGANQGGGDFGSPDGNSNSNNNGNNNGVASGNNGGHGQGFQRIGSNNNLHNHENGNGGSSNNNNRQQGLQGMSRNRTNLSSEKLSNFKNSNSNSNNNNNNNNKSNERGDGSNSATKGSPALVPPLGEEELALLEKKVIRTCKEILREASAKNLKAVELANTLRARVGTSVLAQVREQCQGLLTLLEKQTGVFRVDRIPKNDMVTLISDFEETDDVFANLDDKGSSTGRSLSNDHYLASHMANMYSPSLLNKGLNVSGDLGAASSPWYAASALNQSSITTSSSSSSSLSVGDQSGISTNIQSFFLFSAEPSTSIVIENPNFCSPQNIMAELEQYGQVMLLKKSQIDGKMFFFITYDTPENAAVAKFSISRLMNKAESVNFAILNDDTAPKRRVSSGSGNNSSGHSGTALFSLKEEEMRGFDLLASSMISGNRRYSGQSDTVNSEYTDLSDISERISISESDPAFDLIDYGKPGARSLSHDGYMTSIFSSINSNGNLGINSINGGGNNNINGSNYISPLRGLHTSLSANSLYSMVSNTSSTHSTHTTSGTTGSVGGAASNAPYTSSLTLNLSPPFQIPAICGTPMCHVLQRLCDDTYVPTQLWPVDINNDAFYFQAVIVQLQNFGGQTSISKLRGFLRNRVNAVDNIKSVPLKALLSAYPQLFILKNSQVSLTQYAVNCYGGLSVSSNSGSHVTNSAGYDSSQFTRQDSSPTSSNGGNGNNHNNHLGLGMNNNNNNSNNSSSSTSITNINYNVIIHNNSNSNNFYVGGSQQSSGNNNGHGKGHKNSNSGYRN